MDGIAGAGSVRQHLVLCRGTCLQSLALQHALRAAQQVEECGKEKLRQRTRSRCTAILQNVSYHLFVASLPAFS